ncbi:MAG: hypothetical protein ACLQIB_52680 [Isosphaeraceae bacterium]
MANPKAQNGGDASLVFAAQNIHSEPCGLPPRVRNADNLELYYGYFENGYGEQFVFTFDSTTGRGTVLGGDLGWDNPQAFTLELVEETLRSTQNIAAQIMRGGSTPLPDLPVIDSALALGRLTGLTGKDEIIWLRACLKACANLT